MVRGERRGQLLPPLAEIDLARCMVCAAQAHQEQVTARAKKRAAAILADPSPFAALLPLPASASEADEMSYRIARNILRRSTATGQHFAILLVLGMLADESGYVNDMAQWEIAEAAHCDPSTAKRSLDWLERHGQISVWHGRGGARNRYEMPSDFLLEHDTPEEEGQGQ